MEASEAVQAADAPSEGAESTTTEAPDTGGQEAGGRDYSPIMDRMDQFERSIQDLKTELSPQEPDFFDPGYEDPHGDPTGWGELEDQPGGEYEDFPPEVQQFIDQRVQEKLAPFQQQLSAEQHTRIAEKRNEMSRQIEQQYPELATEEGASQAIKAAQSAALEIGQLDGLPPDIVRGLANSPAFVEVVYLASRARDAAAQEVPADAQQGVELEGTGASPGPEPEEDAQIAAIRRARESGNSGFWPGFDQP